MKEDFDFLKTKAYKFLEMADLAMERKHFDLASLNLEQAVQLFLKHVIGTHLGDFPRIHQIKELILEVSKVLNSEDILKFAQENKDTINDLYKSYFDSRYFDTPFTQTQVKRMRDFVTELINLLNV